MPKPRGTKLKGTEREGVTVHLGFDTDRGVDPVHGGTYSHTYEIKACCVVCRGYGTTTKSRVELEAPNLWIPRDVGLVVVGPRGCSVIRESPRRATTEPIIPWPYLGALRRQRNGFLSDREMQDYLRLERQSIAQLVRWASFRPDPRHGPSYSDTVDP